MLAAQWVMMCSSFSIELSENIFFINDVNIRWAVFPHVNDTLTFLRGEIIFHSTSLEAYCVYIHTERREREIEREKSFHMASYIDFAFDAQWLEIICELKMLLLRLKRIKKRKKERKNPNNKSSIPFNSIVNLSFQ